MNYLLDTHVLIWLDAESERLSPTARTILADTTNDLFVSLASVWEIQIKAQLGKYELRTPLADILRNQRERNRIELFPITLTHILNLEQLPLHHRDPFDRLILAQAQFEQMTLISADEKLSAYSVNRVW